MIDQGLLNDTLQKINSSLNKRFEKDADLYISKQDEYELKKHFCNNAYGAVLDMIKGRNLSPEIVIKVLIRNAGIITVPEIKSFKKTMKPILENAQYKSITYMMEDVLSNSVYMQKELKHLIFKYYIKSITFQQCMEYWNSLEYEFDAIERRALFDVLVFRTSKYDEKRTLSFKLDFIKHAMKKYPMILQDKGILLELKNSSEDEDQEALFRYLCKEMESPFIDDELYKIMLLNVYVSYREKAFDDAISKIRENSQRNFKYYIKAVAQIFVKEKDEDILVRMFDTMVRVYNSPYIKYHIRSRIREKVWKAARANKVLYEIKKEQIDQLMIIIEQKEVSKYIRYQDVFEDIRDGNIINKNIAFSWANMRKKELKQSLVESFDTPNEYLSDLKEIYDWMFRHSQAKAGISSLSDICDSMAAAILSYGEITEMVKPADQLLLNYVLKYSIQGDKIKSYLTTYHFNEFKNDYMS